MTVIMTDRHTVTIPLPRKTARASIAHVPGLYQLMKLPAEAVDYFAHPTYYLTDHCRADLAGSGINVPAFSTYVDRLVRFMRDHPDVGSAAMS